MHRHVEAKALEKKDRKRLLEKLDKEISDLKEIDEAIQKIIGDLEAQAKRLRYQQTLTEE